MAEWSCSQASQGTEHQVALVIEHPYYVEFLILNIVYGNIYLFPLTSLNYYKLMHVFRSQFSPLF